MLLRVFVLAMMSVLLALPSAADDFLSDLASCAKAPLSLSQFALSQTKTAAEFVANHGQCVPMVVGGDALLYGMTGGVAVLQANGTLPSGTGACVDATLGKASRPMAALLAKFVNAPPMATLIPSHGKSQIVDIANGQSQSALYEVEGLGLVMDHVSCSCAVASTGLDIGELKQQIKTVVDSVEGCKGVAAKLFGGAYNAAKDIYGGAKDAVNSVGCSLGLGGCSSGPPFFCTGYIAARDHGTAQSTIIGMFPTFFDSQFIYSEIQRCEGKFVAMVAARQKKAAEEAEAKLLAQEMEKAEKLGAANGLGFAFRWSPKCLDDICKGSIAKFADMYTKDIQDPETLQHYKTFNVAILAMEKKYGALAEVAVALSKDRRDKALRADLNAPPTDRLAAFGCHPFLGRPKQSLCETPEGFEVCRGYVNADAWMSCALSGKAGMYSTKQAIGHYLRDVGCIPEEQRSVRLFKGGSPLQGQCLTPVGRIRCDALAKQQFNFAITCSGPMDAASFDRSRLQRPSAVPPIGSTPRVPPVRSVAPSDPGPARPITVAPPVRRPFAPVAPQASTICSFTTGPRAGQRQDYAPMAPLPLGTPCHDGRGSTGVVVAP